MPALYRPPPGYVDYPFTWIYDGTGLINGQSFRNQSVTIMAGYGDFIMRRAVGFERILNPAGGQFQLYDAQGNGIELTPVNSQGGGEIPILPEKTYPENYKISFDLLNVLKPVQQPLTSQLAFQGVRRVAGRVRDYAPFKPKTFTYVLHTTLTTLAPGLPPIRLVQKVDNYDFDLYQIIFTRHTAGSAGDLDFSCLIYDQNQVALSNAPVLDVFYNGGPGSMYENGALNPPLFYQKDSLITLDLFSMLTVAHQAPPVELGIHLVGVRRQPC